MVSAAPETLQDRDVLGQLSETLSTTKLTYLGKADGPWHMILMAQIQIPAIVSDFI